MNQINYNEEIDFYRASYKDSAGHTETKIFNNIGEAYFFYLELCGLGIGESFKLQKITRIVFDD